MSESARFTIFLSVALAIWTAMNAYALFRISSLPFVSTHLGKKVWLIGIVPWLSFPLGRILERTASESIARPVDVLGSTWLGVLFLLVVGLLLADVLTGLGKLLPDAARPLRLVAVLAALVLSGIALVQGHREPDVRDVEVPIADLSPELDGTTLVLLTDLHLGTTLREGWLAPLVDRVNAMRPDAVLIGGDLVDGNASRVEQMVALIRRFEAQLGVWAVTGNHEFYAGLDRSVSLLREAGVRVLRDEAREAAPGLTIAGVDDLTARKQFGRKGDPVADALRERPPGATVYLCHSPLEAKRAAALGADLMLSGHTHDGQIWPFRHVVRTVFPLVGGDYDVDGMKVVVCRGTGTWGPRMRLFRRSEIVRITLRRG